MFNVLIIFELVVHASVSNLFKKFKGDEFNRSIF